MGRIYLIGFMGTGKSTVGRELEARLGYELIDTDEMIVSRDGRDIPAIFNISGESYFRKLESEVIADIAEKEGNYVVSCGGGVVLSEANTKLMRSSGRVIWLLASPKEILRRLENDSGRPLLQGKKTLSDIEAMMESRYEAYKKAAHGTVDTDGADVSEIASRIIDMMGGD